MADPKALDFQPLELKKFKEVYEADFVTGKLYRIKTRYGNPTRKLIRAKNEQGYYFVNAFGRTIQVHRVLWFMAYGYWPLEVDHKNRKRNDNRLINLRDVTHKENCINNWRGVARLQNV